MKCLLLIILAVFVSACNKVTVTTPEKPLARVYEKYLYTSDLKGIIPNGISGKDSIAMVNDFIERWVRNQLLLNKAENNLTDREKDVQAQIDNYRTSLLIYAYQQSYLQQKLDTIVSSAEVESYYNENQSNYILGETLMKGIFIKVSSKAPEIYKLRQWYRSEDAEDIKKLEGYCFANAAIYDHFNEGWVNINEVLRMIPSGPAMINSLISRKALEISDAGFIYFVSVKEIAPEGTVSPFELVKNDIYSIILNKRKVTLINELETSIYSDAQNREQFNIY